MCWHLTVCASVFRLNGEEAEAAFCDHKRLNMSTLRMTWEAKVQLKEILVNAGFPEGSWQQREPVCATCRGCHCKCVSTLQSL